MLRDLIILSNISNEDLSVQSNNASSQYKNKHSFGLLQLLANEFSLRIIGTYGAAGHGKGAIDVISSFSVKNILRKDIVTQDVFFNNFYDMVEYLASKNPQYYYNIIPAKIVVLARQKDGSRIEIQGCMKQHFIIFKSDEKYICLEYLRDCTFFFINWDSLPARQSSHYEAWSCKKKRHKRIKTCKKSVKKRSTVKRYLLIVDLKAFRS